MLSAMKTLLLTCAALLDKMDRLHQQQHKPEEEA